MAELVCGVQAVAIVAFGVVIWLCYGKPSVDDVVCVCDGVFAIPKGILCCMGGACTVWFIAA